MDHSEAPAPLLIQSGWNDDLFPPDEALRFYNRTRTQYPANPISLFFMDDGHARSQNKAADVAVFSARLGAWFDHYLKGEGAAPRLERRGADHDLRHAFRRSVYRRRLEGTRAR